MRKAPYPQPHRSVTSPQGNARFRYPCLRANSVGGRSDITPSVFFGAKHQTHFDTHGTLASNEFEKETKTGVPRNGLRRRKRRTIRCLVISWYLRVRISRVRKQNCSAGRHYPVLFPVLLTWPFLEPIDSVFPSFYAWLLR
jgi:hypothetical protein